MCTPYSKKRWVARRRFRRLSRLLDIRYESKPRRTRIVLLVSGSVQIEEGEAKANPRLKLPRRLYVDLTPNSPLRRWRGTYWIGDKRVGRVRIARNTRKTTRVVFELVGKTMFRVMVLSRPVRVVIDLSKGRFPRLPGSRMKMPIRQPKMVSRARIRRSHSHHSRSSKYPYVLRYKGKMRLPFPFAVKTIAIDPGHGGREEGAVGRKTGLREKDLTLKIAKQVVAGIHSRLGVKAFLTRPHDQTISLIHRAQIAKIKKADLLISIHINAHTDRRVNGISTYFLDWQRLVKASRALTRDQLFARENQGVHPRHFRGLKMLINGMQIQSNNVISKMLGLCIQRGMMGRVKRRYRRIRDLGVRRGPFYILYAAKIPGVLVEASYLSNRYEERLLRTKRYKRLVAKGIVDGIQRFLQLSRNSQKRAKKKRRRGRRWSKRKRRKRIYKRKRAN